MTKVGILCGNHPVGWYFARRAIENYADKVSFVAMEQPNNIIQQVAQEYEVLIKQYLDEDDIVNLANKTETTIVILAWWPKIIKKIHKVNGITVINTHPSLLPFNRGKHGYYWSIVEKTPFGVTIHKVSDGIDTGDILWQKEIEVLPVDTGESLYKKAVFEMFNLITDNLDKIMNGRFPAGIVQNEKIATSHLAREFDALPLDFNIAKDIVDDLRARTFFNKKSGRKILIDGKLYTIKCYLESYEDS